MRAFGLPMAVTLLALLVSPAGAQGVGRPQDGFYSGQSNGQYSGQWDGQVDSRVDGRASRNEGLPPSAADIADGFRSTSGAIAWCRVLDRSGLSCCQACKAPARCPFYGFSTIEV